MIRVLLLVVLSVSCFDCFSQEAEVYAASSIASDLVKDANAVIRLNQIELILDSQDKMRINLKRVITVFNERGNGYVGAYVGFDNNQKVKKVQAVVFDEQGEQIKKFKRSDFIDHSAVDGGTLYSDSRVLFLPYTPIKYPYTIEFIYEIESPNTAGIPSWTPLETYYLGLEKSTYTLTDNAHLGLRSKEKNFEGFEIESEKTEHSASYSATNIAALKPEELGPSLRSFVPEVMFAVNKFHYDGVDGEASNWKEFGDWMQNALLSGRDMVSARTTVTILELTADIPDAMERAKLVYEFVQNNTRYISVQVGIGGIQPITALEVDKLKYGDCKGLTNYTQALLKIANVNSFYTVVQAGDEIEDFDSDFASLEQGNHIILGIPKDDDMVWIDCTSQYSPFGFIGNFTDSRNVLQVKPNGSTILKTTEYTDADNYQNTTVAAVLNSDASMHADVKIKTTGIQYDGRFFIEKESEDNIQKYYKNYWRYINNLTLTNHTFKNDKDSVQFSEDLKLSAKSYAMTNKDQLIFCPNAFNRNTYVPDRYRNRKTPLVIPRGYVDEDYFTFIIPEDYTVEALPEEFLLETKFGTYQVNFKFENNQIVFTKRLLIKKGMYPKSDYEAYREFRKEILKRDAAFVVLKRKI